MSNGSLSPVSEPLAGQTGHTEAIRTCNKLEGLAAVNNAGTQLVVWPRALPASLKAWLEAMEASRLPDLRVLAPATQVRNAIEPLLAKSKTPRGTMRDRLVADVHNLVAQFARISGADLVDIRLERVTDDACWRFHRDCVEVRLLTTYLGPATEWVQPIDAPRALAAQTRYDGPLERLATGHVAVFKGSLTGSQAGIVHRSPRIAGTGQTRLLLCLNVRSSASPEPWIPQVR